MTEELSRVWWAFLARGLLAILFGILALVWPVISLRAFVTLFAAYVTVDGIFLGTKALRSWSARDDRWLLLIQAVLGVGVGVMTFVAPGVTAVVLLFYIAVWRLAGGILDIVLALRLGKEIKNDIWLLLSGIASTVFAVLLLIFFAGANALGIVWLIAIYVIIYGLLLVITAFRLQRVHAEAAALSRGQSDQ